MTVIGIRSLDDNRVYRIPMRAAAYNVGGAKGCDIVIGNESVLSWHCAFERRPDGSVIVVGTGGGAAVDRKLVDKSAVLTAGSTLQLGKAIFEVLDAIEADVPEPPASEPEPPPKLIDTLDQLRRYIIEELGAELESFEHLGDQERRFQHHIVNALERRMSPTRFSVGENVHLPQCGRFPDVLIEHEDQRRVAIEIKKNGALDPLKDDAQKLKDYLRLRRTRVTFGVLIYRSPLAVPSELSRAMRGDDLHLICVRTPRHRR